MLLSVPAAMVIGAKAPVAPRGLHPRPAHLLRAVVAGEHPVAGRKRFDRHLPPVGHGDAGAAGEGDGGGGGQPVGGAVAVDGDEGVAGLFRKCCKRMEIDLRDRALPVVHFNKNKHFPGLTGGVHEGEQAVEVERRTGPANGAVGPDTEGPGLVGGGKGEAHRAGVFAEHVDIFVDKFGSVGQRIAIVHAMGNPEHICTKHRKVPNRHLDTGTMKRHGSSDTLPPTRSQMRVGRHHTSVNIF